MKGILESLSEVLGFNLRDFQEVLDNSCTGKLYNAKELQPAFDQCEALNNLCTNLYKNGKVYSIFEIQNYFTDGSSAFIIATKEEMAENYAERVYKEVTTIMG